jgi:hypothetical protein
MRRLPHLFALFLIGGCSMPGAGPEPSLAPRAAEAIDPRVPIPDAAPSGPADPALAQRLDALVGQVQAGVSAFEAREAEAARLAADAGPSASEGWVAAQQALSRLIEQHGVTTRAAADIDELASTRLEARRWITPADQRALSGAAADVAAISDAQTATIKRLQDQLAR